MKALLNILLVALLFSCNEDKLPEGILPLDKMSSLVEDISVLEAHFQSQFGVPSQYKAALDKSVTSILEKESCSREKFKKSLRYYAAHPALQKALNDAVLTSLSRKLN
jgi:hypothetical protein